MRVGCGLVVVQTQLVKQLLLGRRYGRVEAFPAFARKVNEVSFGLEEQLLFVLGEICIEQLRLQANVEPILVAVGMDA